MSARMAWESISSTFAPIMRSISRTFRSSPAYRRSVWVRGMDRGSAEATRDVVLRPGIGRLGEDDVGVIVLHDLAQIEERRQVRYARRLLHAVRNDHDRVA